MDGETHGGVQSINWTTYVTSQQSILINEDGHVTTDMPYLF